MGESDGVLNSTNISIAIARHFGTRKNIIVPNVSWGIGLHECDVLIITRSGYAIEIEIKISRADIIKDAMKWHKHHSNKLRSLIFAIPKELQHCTDLIPERAGIIIVSKKEELRPSWHSGVVGPNSSRLYCSMFRKAEVNRSATKMSDDDILHVAKLGTMRVWNLLEKLQCR